MNRTIPALLALALLAACGDGNPLFDGNGNAIGNGGTPSDEVPESEQDEAGTGGDIDVGAVLPGTDNPTLSGSILRFEERNEDNGGLVTDVSYDANNDTFSVDNIGFDGANI